MTKKQLTNLRLQKGISISLMAKKLGYHKATFYQWETGKRTMPKSVQNQYLELLWNI